ncbi:MAG TPA: NAD(P)/FAD-dependent oxidoreductase [Virgibacillus sp.]|nr:NAD(P)/FAD-dependent oxidoreductase [Virgibacillus sp.]
MIYDVIVIGGGPSGLMAAISAAEQGSKTMLLEKGNKLGNKLAISGGGRCNVTNRIPKEKIIENIPGNGKFLYSAFSVFDNYDIINYFENMGVQLKEEDHGRMFPVSNSAKSVVDTLVNKLDTLYVNVRKNTPVQTIVFNDDLHTVILTDEEEIQTQSIVIAVGGKSVPHTGSTGDGYKWAEAAGHTITTLYPTEVALTSDEEFIKNKTLQGLSLQDVRLSVLNKKGKEIISHQMDMVFTHFGVSGPAVLRCSQFVVKELMKGPKEVQMTLDIFPDRHQDELIQQIFKLIADDPKRTFKNILKGIIPERLLTYFLNEINITDQQKAGNISKETVRLFTELLKNFIFKVNGSLSIEKAFVTGGGVSVKEIIPNTMQSKQMNHLFFCGEILDIHGYTGGYNITSALITGRLAGVNAAHEATR